MTDTVIQHTIQIPHFVGSTTNLCSPRLGTVALRCSDDSFASRERMLAETDPVFKPDVYDDFGKWMDGWESKRRRYGGHDWCVNSGALTWYWLHSLQAKSYKPSGASNAATWSRSDAIIGDAVRRAGAAAEVKVGHVIP